MKTATIVTLLALTALLAFISAWLGLEGRTNKRALQSYWVGTFLRTVRRAVCCWLIETTLRADLEQPSADGSENRPYLSIQCIFRNNDVEKYNVMLPNEFAEI